MRPDLASGFTTGPLAHSSYRKPPLWAVECESCTLGLLTTTDGPTDDQRKNIDLDVGLKRILQDNVPESLIDLPYSEEAEARFPAIAGGLSLALARTFTVMDPHTNPGTKEVGARFSDI
jgi:hypothetical protein